MAVFPLSVCASALRCAANNGILRRVVNGAHCLAAAVYVCVLRPYTFNCSIFYYINRICFVLIVKIRECKPEAACSGEQNGDEAEKGGKAHTPL